MIAFHKINFPHTTAWTPAEIFVGRGGKPKKHPPPHAHEEKVAKNWQRSPHVKKKAPLKKKRGFFTEGGGARANSPPCWCPCRYYFNNHIYFLKRTFSENTFQDAPNCTINKHSGVCSNTPKYGAP